MNLARLGEESVQTWGEYVSLAFEGRELTNVEQQRGWSATTALAADGMG